RGSPRPGGTKRPGLVGFLGGGDALVGRVEPDPSHTRPRTCGRTISAIRSHASGARAGAIEIIDTADVVPCSGDSVAPRWADYLMKSRVVQAMSPRIFNISGDGGE